MRCSVILAISFLLMACNPDKDAYTYFIQEMVIVDSTAQGKQLLSFDQSDNAAYYPVYYIGKQTDTIFIGNHPISMFSNEKLETQYDTARNWNSINDMNIEVFVDTSVHVGHDIMYTHIAEDSDFQIIDSTQSIAAFTVVLRNNSDSLVMMGSHNFVGYLTRQVQTIDGQWVDIEHRMTDLCGTAKRNLILEPNDIMVAKLLRYNGQTKIPCRLKLSMKFGNVEAYTTYSNIYTDYFDVNNLPLNDGKI